MLSDLNAQIRSNDGLSVLEICLFHCGTYVSIMSDKNNLSEASKKYREKGSIWLIALKSYLPDYNGSKWLWNTHFYKIDDFTFSSKWVTKTLYPEDRTEEIF